MGDPYRRYSTSTSVPPERERGSSVARPSFPGYLLSDATPSATHSTWGPGHAQGASSDYLRKDVLPLRSGAYGLDDINGIRVSSEPIIGGLAGIPSIHRYSSPLDPILVSQRRDPVLGVSPGIQEVVNETPSSLGNANGHPVVPGESNILFVDGLPKDCTRREVGHLFRPFIGFKEIRVVHKEARHMGDKAMVLCFVEFNDAKCALTAMEALQGYKFDDKKPESPSLRISFAHFPFRPPLDLDKECGVLR